MAKYSFSTIFGEFSNIDADDDGKTLVLSTNGSVQMLKQYIEQKYPFAFGEGKCLFKIVGIKGLEVYFNDIKSRIVFLAIKKDLQSLFEDEGFIDKNGDYVSTAFPHFSEDVIVKSKNKDEKFALYHKSILINYRFIRIGVYNEFPSSYKKDLKEIQVPANFYIDQDENSLFENSKLWEQSAWIFYEITSIQTIAYVLEPQIDIDESSNEFEKLKSELFLYRFRWENDVFVKYTTNILDKEISNKIREIVKSIYGSPDTTASQAIDTYSKDEILTAINAYQLLANLGNKEAKYQINILQQRLNLIP